MAFPTTPDILSAPDVSCTRPFLSSGGDVYVIGRGLSPNQDQLRVYSSSDPSVDANWTEQDGAGRPDNGGFLILSVWAVQNGDLIHVVTQHTDASGHTTVYPVEYHRFSMATDSWVTANENVDSPSGIGSEVYGNAITACAITVFSDDDSVIAFQDSAAADMGTSYMRVSWVTRTAAGTYGTITGFSVPVAGLSYYLNAGVEGASERVHFFINGREGDDASDWRVYHQSLSGTTLDTMDEFDTDTGVNICGFGHAFSWDDGGTVRVRIPRALAAEGMVELDSGANPTISHDTSAHDNNAQRDAPGGDADSQLTVAQMSGHYVSAFDREYVVYVRDSDDDIYYTSQEAGGGWAADTRHTDQVPSVLKLSANIFQRDGSYRLAILYHESAATETLYDEVDLGNPGGSLAVPHPAQNNTILRL